jgi:cytochrome c556
MTGTNMRLMVGTCVLCLLAACRGPDASQANNAQANISDAARPADTAAGTAVTNTPQSVSGDKAKQVMHERHEGMETIGKQAKTIKRELDGASPNLGTVRMAAGKIAELSTKASGWFPAGTGPDVGKTGAKPAIWQPQNQQDFAKKLSDFQKAAQAFNNDASGNDVNLIKTDFSKLGGACKACHDKYRTDMHH